MIVGALGWKSQSHLLALLSNLGYCEWKILMILLMKAGF